MDVLGSQITISIAVSLITSGIVSIFGYAIGVRVGKEQCDRQLLRDTYQRIYDHLSIIAESIAKGRPKVFSDYPLKGDRYCPLIHSMKYDGTISLLPKHVSSKLLEIEKAAFAAAWKFRDLAEKEIGPRIRNVVDEYVKVPSNVVSGKSYTPIYPKQMLLSGRRISEITKNRPPDTFGYSLEVSFEKGMTLSCYIYETNLKRGNVADFLREVEEAVFQEGEIDGEAKILRSQKQAIEALLPDISSRIRDPHPFFETVRGTICDVLRIRST